MPSLKRSSTFAFLLASILALLWAQLNSRRTLRSDDLQVSIDSIASKDADQLRAVNPSLNAAAAIAHDGAAPPFDVADRRIRVVDAQRKPVTSAHVRLSEVGGLRRFDQRTNAAGIATFPALDSGLYTIDISHNDYAMFAVSRMITGDEEIQLVAGVALSLRIADWPDQIWAHGQIRVEHASEVVEPRVFRIDGGDIDAGRWSEGVVHIVLESALARCERSVLLPASGLVVVNCRAERRSALSVRLVGSSERPETDWFLRYASADAVVGAAGETAAPAFKVARPIGDRCEVIPFPDELASVFVAQPASGAPVFSDFRRVSGGSMGEVRSADLRVDRGVTMRIRLVERIEGPVRLVFLGYEDSSRFRFPLSYESVRGTASAIASRTAPTRHVLQVLANWNRLDAGVVECVVPSRAVVRLEGDAADASVAATIHSVGEGESQAVDVSVTPTALLTVIWRGGKGQGVGSEIRLMVGSPTEGGLGMPILVTRFGEEEVVTFKGVSVPFRGFVEGVGTWGAAMVATEITGAGRYSYSIDSATARTKVLRVRVHDDAKNPVEGAAVGVSYSGGLMRWAATDLLGVAVLRIPDANAIGLSIWKTGFLSIDTLLGTRLDVDVKLNIAASIRVELGSEQRRRLTVEVIRGEEVMRTTTFETSSRGSIVERLIAPGAYELRVRDSEGVILMTRRIDLTSGRETVASFP